MESTHIKLGIYRLKTCFCNGDHYIEYVNFETQLCFLRNPIKSLENAV